MGGSYPIGGFVPMAVMTEITGQDLAFTLQPSMAVAAVILSLLLFELSRRLRQGVGASVAVAVVAPLSALLLGYYLWGGVKELVMAALLPLGPILAGQADRRRMAPSAFVSIAITIAAIVAVLGPRRGTMGGAAADPGAVRCPADATAGGALGPDRRSDRGTWPDPAAASDLRARTGPSIRSTEGVTGEAEIGNLYRPLSLLQAAGIWPSLDFRISTRTRGPDQAAHDLRFASRRVGGGGAAAAEAGPGSPWSAISPAVSSARR